jgi:carbamoyltransferase
MRGGHTGGAALEPAGRCGFPQLPSPASVPQLILAVHSGAHDAAAAVFSDYSLIAAVQLERLTRRKGDGSVHPDACIDEVLSIAGAARGDVDVALFSRTEMPTHYLRTIRGVRWLREQYRRRVEKRSRRYLTAELVRYQTTDVSTILDIPRLSRESGFRPDTIVRFYNHHEAHALPILFHTGWDDALLVTADAGGDTVNYSHRHFADGAIRTVYGGEECLLTPLPVDSLGHAYMAATAALGFTPLRHEGKLTGLAAFGEPVVGAEIATHFSVDEAGRVYSDFPDYPQMRAFITKILYGIRREDAAASIQQVLEDTMLLSLRRLLHRHPTRNLGLAGGVFANVKLNRVLAECLPLDEIFIFPAMGDEGLPVGGALCHLLQRDGLPHWLAQRRPLRDVYLGRDYTDTIDASLRATLGVRRASDAPSEEAGRRLAAGQIGAIYTGRMEYGPRALGARSILANPSRRETHDLLNTRLDRSEFMPFAPVIAAERAAEVFDVNRINAYASRFMTITCNVWPEWRERIAAVVHADGSARPQMIECAANPLYYDILVAFERYSGLPVLINTSFNVHEEPIVNQPSECLQALLDKRIDFVVTTQGVYDYSTN